MSGTISSDYPLRKKMCIIFCTGIDDMNDVRLHEIHDFVLTVETYLYDNLTKFEEVEVYGPLPLRAALCAFNVRRIHCSDLAKMLDLGGVAIRSEFRLSDSTDKLLAKEPISPALNPPTSVSCWSLLLLSLLKTLALYILSDIITDETVTM